MAGNFTSPSGAPPKMHVGKVNRPKRAAVVGTAIAPKPEYPITDSFASSSIPSFATRRANTNNKSGWNTEPSRPPHGGNAEFVKVSAPERGRGHNQTAMRGKEPYKPNPNPLLTKAQKPGS
jgi:hypothetical protein